MTDVILAVDDTRKFHEANMAAHPEHYSFLASLGVDVVQAAQSLGARVYYNTHVTVENMVCRACAAARQTHERVRLTAIQVRSCVCGRPV
jgi:hypothetical protein